MSCLVVSVVLLARITKTIQNLDIQKDKKEVAGRLGDCECRSTRSTILYLLQGLNHAKC